MHALVRLGGLLRLVRLALLVVPVAGMHAQETGVIAGVVVDTASGAPLAGARVRLVEQHRAWQTHQDGVFSFGALPAGVHTLAVEVIGYRPFSRTIRLATGDTARVRVALAELRFELPPLVVTGTLAGRSGEDVLSPTAVVVGAELDRRLSGTIAATLKDQPGVAVTSISPATARPVIRGLGGDRILVLEDGLRPGDLSAMSSDHAVAIEPVTAHQFEVVRGPMSLMYGSSALGGVVNVIREEVPTSRPQDLHGSLSVQGASVNTGLTTAATVSGGLAGLAWRGEASGRWAGNTRTPVGELVNTGLTTYSGALGAARVGGSAHAGGSYRFYANRYGIPGGFVGGHAQGVDIEMFRHTGRLEAQVHDLDLPFSTVKGSAQYSHYQHTEYEPSGAIGTRFTQQLAATEWSARHDPSGALAQGAVGLRAQFRDIQTGGTLRTPSTYDWSLAGFAVEELGRGATRLQLGARYDWARFVPRDTTAFVSAGGERIPVRPRTFGSVSGSAALLFVFSDAVRVGASLARAFRTPDFNELYSNGPHLADNSFNVGSPSLGPETGLGADLFVRLSGSRLRGEVAAFRNVLTDYVFPSSRGRAELGAQGGRPRFQFTNEDARFTGMEGDLEWQVAGPLVVEATASYVEAVFTSTRDSIPVITATDTTFLAPSPYPPFIAPLHGHVGLRLEPRPWFVGVTARGATRQDRLGDFEDPTDGYVVTDVTVGTRVLLGGRFHAVTLNLDNAFDVEYRDHLSRIKAIMPQPGRSVSLLYRLEF
ncbi:MAG TPA: TonB-dependent receptor [Gemmatimonadales bacterium]|nr:TonB-dependent receptor [Gemmatimonadales bacterium]